MNDLRTFWIRFETIRKPTALNLGCGVTASDRESAIWIVQRYIFGNQQMPKIINVIEDVDLDLLDKGHVIPNIGDIDALGIWFPQGYTGDFN